MLSRQFAQERDPLYLDLQRVCWTGGLRGVPDELRRYEALRIGVYGEHTKNCPVEE